MPFYYSTVPTADVATSATANTTVDHLRTLTVGRDTAITKLDLVGKGAAQSTITGIEVRISRFTTTVSSVGTAITPVRRNPDFPAPTLTAFTGPTIGTPEAIIWAGGMMSSGQGGFVPIDPVDDAILLANGGGVNGNADVLSQSEGAVALNFKYTLGTREL
jgi:hypothetical protein